MQTNCINILCQIQYLCITVKYLMRKRQRKSSSILISFCFWLSLLCILLHRLLLFLIPPNRIILLPTVFPVVSIRLGLPLKGYFPVYLSAQPPAFLHPYFHFVPHRLYIDLQNYVIISLKNSILKIVLHIWLFFHFHLLRINLVMIQLQSLGMTRWLKCFSVFFPSPFSILILFF